MSDKPANPMESARRLMRPELPRRFYKEATIGRHEAGFVLLLDGRGAKTPARNALVVRNRALAVALAAEWNGQSEHVDPATMPLTRLFNAAVDRVALEMAAVRSEIVKYAGNDLLCYRAEGPGELVARQEAAWSPLILWAEARLGIRFNLASGIVHVEQNARTLAAIDNALAGYDALNLAALSTATTLTGSAVLALAVAHGRLDAREAWALAHVDEDWQMEQWGADEIALQRRAARWREMEAAALVLSARD